MVKQRRKMRQCISNSRIDIWLPSEAIVAKTDKRYPGPKTINHIAAIVKKGAEVYP